MFERNRFELIRAAALALAIAGSCLPHAGRAGAQIPGEVEEPTEVEQVVVTARRIGVPVWRVSQGSATLILVGEMQGVPKDAPWRPAELERAVAQADAVIFPHNVRGSPADVARILWRTRSFVFLPRGKTLADHVDARGLERLRALGARGVEVWLERGRSAPATLFSHDAPKVDYAKSLPSPSQLLRVIRHEQPGQAVSLKLHQPGLPRRP